MLKANDINYQVKASWHGKRSPDAIGGALKCQADAM